MDIPKTVLVPETELAQQVRDYWIKSGLTQRDLADRLSASQPAISAACNPDEPGWRELRIRLLKFFVESVPGVELTGPWWIIRRSLQDEVTDVA